MDALHDIQESYSTFRPAPDRGGNVYLCQCGFQHCESLHNFGPAVRDHYLIHCVLSGKGTFTVGDRKFRLSAGQGFLIHPNIITTYTADAEDPWYYCWVGFGGDGAEFIMNQCGLTLEHPTFFFQNPEKMEKCVRDINRSINPGANPFATMARLYEFFALLYRENDPQRLASQGAVESAMEYAMRNYSYGVTVEELARHVGVDRSHLFRLFKKLLGMSPQEYLLSFKLARARELMESTDLSVTEIMYSCGFNDLSNFSKQFKKVYGSSPASFRKAGGYQGSRFVPED